MVKNQSIIDLWVLWGNLLRPSFLDGQTQATRLGLTIHRLSELCESTHGLPLEEVIRIYIGKGWIKDRYPQTPISKSLSQTP